MTAPAPARSPAETSRLAQAAVAAAAGDLVLKAWPHLDIARLRTSLPGFKRLIAAIVGRYGQASAAAAVTYYRQERQLARVEGLFTPRPAEPPPVEQVDGNVDWATHVLWRTDPDVELARDQVQAAAEQLVINTGRRTIMDNAAADREADGWARIPEPGACYFCAMLATRGAVYESRESAGPNKRGPRNKRAGLEFDGPGEFKVHDHCRCHAKPIFGVYEPSAEIRGWEALWKRSQKESPADMDAITAFRQAYEGRAKWLRANSRS